jgi:hypothetical protein
MNCKIFIYKFFLFFIKNFSIFFSGVDSTVKYNDSNVMGKKNKYMQESIINTMIKYKQEVFFKNL